MPLKNSLDISSCRWAALQLVFFFCAIDAFFGVSISNSNISSQVKIEAARFDKTVGKEVDSPSAVVLSRLHKKRKKNKQKKTFMLT